jgi:hypothetical protein
VATKSNYLFQKHPQIESEDLLTLPIELQEDFRELYKPILMADPYRCGGFPNHALTGRLKDYRTLEIDWEGISYRLVYRDAVDAPYNFQHSTYFLITTGVPTLTCSYNALISAFRIRKQPWEMACPTSFSLLVP